MTNANKKSEKSQEEKVPKTLANTILGHFSDILFAYWVAAAAAAAAVVWQLYLTHARQIPKSSSKLLA